MRRPWNVAKVLASLRAATPEPHDVLFVTNSDDVPERVAIERAGAERIDVDGNYAQKVNEAVRRTDHDLVFLGADDLHFHPGWLEAALAQLRPGIGVVGTNDLGNRRTMNGTHSTHSLVTRAYCALGTIDDPSRLLHEGYLHEWVDDEFVQTAQHRCAYAHAADSVVEHLHPNWGKAESDSIYGGQRRRMRRGRVLYEQRRHLWT